MVLHVALDRQQSKWLRAAKKLAVAVGMTFLFVLLGLYNGVGFHINSMKEIYFRPQSLGYADAAFSCDVVYNPLLYPFYWVAPGVNGRITGNFSIRYVPEGYTGESGRAVYPRWPHQRFDTYVAALSVWGTMPNLILLFLICLIIEAAGTRTLYLAVFSGIIGFFSATLLGMMVGLLAGVSLVLYIRFRLPKDNAIFRFWDSLWE